MIGNTGTYRENTPLNNSINTCTSPTSSLAGRRISVNWGLEFTEGRTWRGWLYTLGKLVNHLANNIFSCSFSWTITTTITTDEHRDLVTDEWFDSQNRLNESSLSLISRTDLIPPNSLFALDSSADVTQITPEASTGNRSSYFTLDTSHKTLDNSSQAPARSLEVESPIGEEIRSIQSIDRNYAKQTPWTTQVKNHEIAKVWLQKSFETIGSAITFFSPPERTTVLLSEAIIPEGEALQFNPEVFGWKRIYNLRTEIEKDGQGREEEITVYTLGSDYDIGHRPNSFEVKPGTAVRSYTSCLTCEANGRLAFSNEQVELLNCAAHKGYNGLIYLVNENTKGDVYRSFLKVYQEHPVEFLQELQKNGHKIQYPCVGSVPNGGGRVVYQMFVPGFIHMDYNPLRCPSDTQESHLLRINEMKEIDFLIQLDSWRAQFAQCIALAEKTAQPVHFKAQDSQIVNKHAFYKAIKEYEDQLAVSKVRVTFQTIHPIWKGQVESRFMALQLKESEYRNIQKIWDDEEREKTSKFRIVTVF